jgi:DNA transposition AAA+ family ATPase
MADVFTPEQRSRVMSKIRASKNKSTELRLEKSLERIALSDGERTILFLESLILPFRSCESLSSLTDASGTAMTAKILGLNPMRNTGTKRSTGTFGRFIGDQNFKGEK